MHLTEAHDAEHSVSFTAIADGVVNDVVLISCLVFCGFLHVGQTFFHAPQIDLRKALVEQHLCGE